MKKLFFRTLVVCLTLVLIGCFGQAVKPSGKVQDNKFVSDDFSIDVPLDWEVITDYPESIKGNAIVSIRNHVKDRDFVANANVSYTPIKKGIDIKAFANKLLETHKDTLKDFKLVSTQEYEIPIGDGKGKTVMNIFQGKPSSEFKQLQITQIYAFKGQRIYTVTGMYELKDEPFAREKVDQMIRSFKIL